MAANKGFVSHGGAFEVHVGVIRVQVHVHV